MLLYDHFIITRIHSHVTYILEQAEHIQSNIDDVIDFN
jgi:hypothetical protein